MNKSRGIKIGSIILYSIGIAVFVVLVGLVLFGNNLIPFPDAMIPWTMRDYAFV
jgi:hypothetical protein